MKNAKEDCRHCHYRQACLVPLPPWAMVGSRDEMVESQKRADADCTNCSVYNTTGRPDIRPQPKQPFVLTWKLQIGQEVWAVFHGPNGKRINKFTVRNRYVDFARRDRGQPSYEMHESPLSYPEDRVFATPLEAIHNAWPEACGDQAPERTES